MLRFASIAATLLAAGCVARRAPLPPEVPTRIFESHTAALECAADAAKETGFDVTDLTPSRSWFVARRVVSDVTPTSSRADRVEQVTIAATPIAGSEAWRVHVSPVKGFMGRALIARQQIIDRCITTPARR